MGIFAGVIILSVLSAYHFAKIHNLYHDLGIESGGSWIGTDESWYFILGLFDAFPFFIGLLIVALFQSWYRWIFAILFSFLIPAMFLFDSQLDIKDGGIIMIFAITGLGLGWLVGWAREGLVKK